MSKVKKSLHELNIKLLDETSNTSTTFEQFLDDIDKHPLEQFQNINMILHDVIKKFMKKEKDEYQNDPHSIDFVKYDCSQLFVENCDHPYFSDRLMSNYLIRTAESLLQGSLKNKMIVFSGPPGSGKSTFINNFLNKVESYTKTEDGSLYQSVWHIDGSLFNDDKEIGKVVVPCPHHDHPILQIPKSHRKEFLKNLISDKKLLKTITTSKRYQWIFKNQCCPICSSIYKSLLDRGTSPQDILSMLHVSRYEFSRKLGDGISIYNPGDKNSERALNNKELQKSIDQLFGNSDSVKYLYSTLAKTNNGVYVIMDVKSNNTERLKNIHGVISDGTNKVGTLEENISCIFMTIVNPNDKEIITEESYNDRIVEIPIPYVRDYNTEIEIYKSFYGDKIDKDFLPGVLKSFVKTIIMSRLFKSSELDEWIDHPYVYDEICDTDLMLLQIEIYSGNIPFWLKEIDTENFDKKTRTKVIKEGEYQGQDGISGRESVQIFNDFYSKFKKKESFIDIEQVVEFFQDYMSSKKEQFCDNHFLDSLKDNYQFELIQQIKEAMFFYNKQQIDNDIKNYLFAVSSDPNAKATCPYTNQIVKADYKFFYDLENRLLPSSADSVDKLSFRDACLKTFVAKTLHQVNGGTKLEDTAQYKQLVKRYNQNLKQHVLDPFIENQNFRRAIIDYGNESFKKYDKRLREEVEFLLSNLVEKYGYTDVSAKQVCVYVLDKNLPEKFKNILE